MHDGVNTMVDWKAEYKAKEALLRERGFQEVSPYEFYRDMFPKGSLQSEQGDGKGNVIATQIRPSGRGRTKQWIVDDSLKMLEKVVGDEFGLVPPIAFYGKTHRKQNAHELYAVAVDIDYVGEQQLKNLLKQFGNGVQLRPTYLVSSGKGVHVYYFLQEPVQLYHNLESTLAALKESFIRRLWNDTSSLKPDDPDITGIYQGFRCVGSQSKLGEAYPVRAYRLSDNRYTLEDIKASIPDCKVDLSVLTVKPRLKDNKRMPIEKAKQLYPEWYQARVIEGQPKKKGTWTCNEALYEWWKAKIITNVKVGGRYFSIMALCAYGLKCGIPEKQIKKDAYSFLDHLESLTDDETNHFTREDVKDALKALQADNKLLSTMASREWIEKQTKVPIPPNKRNGRKQAVHVQFMNLNRQFKVMNGECTNGGRPTAQARVQEWRLAHPEGMKADCVRDTGLDKKTVYKWWD
ncbi:repa [Eubacterium coprostanoligenes]|uniref:repa n=1 Tax=Eubacterium coprostanoligenes TaxID=290054 RepID=UPI002352CADF|nr:repa [Eubacterium coprostanoligenes]MCI6254978.1 repa [Eubacterium coprostanoligenes]